MTDPRRPTPPGRRLARLIVRGPEAPFVLTDLEDAFERDLANGVPVGRARRRYAANAAASAASLLVSRLRPTGLRFSWIDVKLGLRMLLKHPGLTLVATFALAVGIPVGLAPMHAVDALEANLPEDPDGRIRMLRYWNVGQATPTTFDDVARWRSSLSSFESIGASRMGTYNLEIAGAEIVAPGAEVTASTFEMLAVPPARGRVFRAEDDVPGGPDLVVVSETIARSAGTAAADLVGTTVRIGGVPHEVIGVMPEDFRFPRTQLLWLPLRDQPTPAPHEARPLTVFGRLADGVTPEAAQLELSAVHAAMADEGPEGFERRNPEVVHSSFMVFGFPRGGLRALPEFAVVQVLTLVPLVIACVNVGLLIFARTATRASEFAVRTALGASRGRILAQVFTESLVLALLATGVGLLILSWLPARLLNVFAFIPMPYWLTPELSSTTLIRAIGLACASAVIAGVVPVLRTTSRSVLQGLQRASTQRAGTPFGLTSSVMIVVDVAVAVAAVGFATGVAHRVAATFADVRADGIQADRYLSVTLAMAGDSSEPGIVADPAAFRARFASTQAALVDRLRSEPGVRGVAVGTTLPRMDHRIRFVEVDGEDLGANAPGHGVRMAEVGIGFFEALRSPVLAGRAFDGRDLDAAPSTVIVNSTFVERVLGGRPAVGRRLRYRSGGDAPPGPWHEIVGVVGHLGMHSLTPDQDDGVYHPLVPGSAPRVLIAIEADGDPMALAPRVREIARAIDARAVIASPTTLDRVFEGDWYIMSAIVCGAVVLVGVLLTLAASGLYAMLSFTVAARTREIGIRVALGADRRRIVLQVVRRALVQIAIGVVLGLPLALRVFYEMQEAAGATPSTLRAVGFALAEGVGIMLLVAVAACLVPAQRALRISPAAALRGDG